MKPSLLYIQNNEMSLIHESINDYQGEILRQYLEETTDKENEVLSFIIDQCNISDRCLASILYGICGQRNRKD